MGSARPGHWGHHTYGAAAGARLRAARLEDQQLRQGPVGPRASVRRDQTTDGFPSTRFCTLQPMCHRCPVWPPPWPPWLPRSIVYCTPESIVYKRAKACRTVTLAWQPSRSRRRKRHTRRLNHAHTAHRPPVGACRMEGVIHNVIQGGFKRGANRGRSRKVFSSGQSSSTRCAASGGAAGCESNGWGHRWGHFY